MKVLVEAKSRYHHGDLRAQLLVAVQELIETKGHANFSISEASRLAGVSSAAPYKHFADKPAILKALVLECMERMSVKMLAAIADLPVGSKERLDALGQTYVDFARQEPGMFRLVFGLTEAHQGDDELSQAGQQVFGIVIQATAECLGIEASAPEAMERAYMLWSFVHGHSFLVIDGKVEAQKVSVDDAKLLRGISTAVLQI
ncbi:MAG: TetR/AcrR family transcriptional regulator [Pseudomonadota bacterium]